MSKVNYSKIINALFHVKERPQMHIGKPSVESLECFIHGFNSGCFFANSDIDSAKHRKLLEQITVERGWLLRPVSVSVEMRERGMSEPEIIQELLTIEIEAWSRLEKISFQSKE
jgi:hypothetical protein